MGPLLFVLYINDIAKLIFNAKIILFADDILIYTAQINVIDSILIINKLLQIISIWSASNKLALNPKKSQALLFHNIPANINSLILNNTIFNFSENVEYLGITIQSNLKFDIHINNLVSTISRYTGILYSVKKSLPVECLLKIYYAFIYPHLNLHILAWGSAPASTLNNLQVSQNKALRTIFSINSSSAIFTLFKLKNLEDIYNFKLATLMFISQHSNDNFSSKIKEFEWSHSYNTRRIQLHRRPISRLSYLYRFWVTRGLSLWDTLPRDLRDSTSLSRFKSEYNRMCIK